MRKRKRKISPAMLVKRYCVEELSTGEIARLHKMNRRTVYGRLRRLGVKLRTQAEAMRLRKKRNLKKEREFLITKYLKKYLGEPRSALDDLVDEVIQRDEERKAQARAGLDLSGGCDRGRGRCSG